MSDFGEIMRLFRDNWGLPGNGMVEPSRFEEIRTAVEELRESFIVEAGEEAEKAARIWPYQDREADGEKILTRVTRRGPEPRDRKRGTEMREPFSTRTSGYQSN